MELVHSPQNSYRVLELLYSSHKCRVLLTLGQDERRYILHQWLHGQSIAHQLLAFDQPITDFQELWWQGDWACATFTYHMGTPVAEITTYDLPALLQHLLDICTTFETLRLPTPILVQIMREQNLVQTETSVACHVICPFDQETPLPSPNALTELLVARLQSVTLNRFQRAALKPLQTVLQRPYQTTLDVYRALLRFSQSFRYQHPTERIKHLWQTLKDCVMGILTTLDILVVSGAAILAAMVVIAILLASQQKHVPALTQAGSYPLNGRGAIYADIKLY